MFKDSNGRWRTTLGEAEGDKFGPTNDRLRILAAALLWQKNPNYKILVLGGKGQLVADLNAPTVASIIKQELISLGVLSTLIKLEQDSSNTSSQLKNLIEIIRATKGNLSQFIIISNEWHLPRVKTMIEYSELKNILGNGQVNFVAAENILLRLKPAEWRKFIEKSRKSEGMKKRFDIEAKGVEQIKKGIYKTESND